MASSGYTDVQATKHDILRFNWSVTSQSIADNTSTIAWSMQLIAENYGKIISNPARAYSVVINGQTFSGSTYVAIENYETKTLASGTAVIPHNSDGTKSFSFSFSQEFKITFSSVWIDTVSGSGTGTLDTIPRRSTLSVSDGTLEKAQTLTVTRHSTAFTHTITWASGTYSGTVCTKSANTSVPFTPPDYLANGAPNGTSVYVTFTIETFNGNTSLGSNGPYPIWCIIPDTAKYKPSCTLSVSDETGYLTTYGSYLKNLSKLKIGITPTTAYGSSIASYSTVVDGYTYSAASFITGVLTTTGSVTITTTVTDTRGRSGTATKTITVTNYELPSIKYLKVKRVNRDGEDNDQGAYIMVQCRTRFTYLNGKNANQHKLQYSKSNEETWTTQIMEFDPEDSPDGEYFTRSSYLIFEADTGSSYQIRLDASDSFKTVTVSTAASTASTILHFPADGTGLGIGKVVETSGNFELAYPAEFFETAHFRQPMTYDIPICDSGYDCDNMPASGMFYMGVSALNKPKLNNGATPNGWLEVMKYGSNHEYQRYVTYNGLVGERLKENGVWYPWIHVRSCTDDSGYTIVG